MALLEFRSKAAAGFYMMSDTFKAAKREKLEREGRGGFMTFEEEEEEKKAREHVPMSVRIFPLLDMMQKAAKKKQNVMWGVP